MAMQLSQTMRQEMRQLLTPRMIQSMEILQLPLLALEQRIEQELQSNPVLEIREGSDEEEPAPAPPVDEPKPMDQFSEDERPLVVKEDTSQADDFDRLEKLGEYLENEEFFTNQASNYRVRAADDGERDKKLDAMSNTAARGEPLTEYLMRQWAFVECPPAVHRAGEAIINYIDGEGYMRTDLEQILTEQVRTSSASTAPKSNLTLADLQAALPLVQTLEPAGIGARSVGECLLLQLDALEDESLDTGDEDGHDFDLERKVVQDHLKDLEMNRYPQISRKLGRPITDIQRAVKSLSRLHPHPGKLISPDDAPPITPDAIVYLDEETNEYKVEMTNDRAPSLYISGMYRKMLKDRAVDKKTREFLATNVRNARWLIESIEQRNSTILRVIRAVVAAQRDFFDRGPEFLRPLPMIHVAEQLGIHVATVSRAVSEKWIQTPRGIYPLRRFFSGGTTSADGEDMSWDAVKEKLKTIIENEDKLNPLNDDEIVEKLKAQGIDIARRTVAKYRKILAIPAARQRRQF